MSTRSPDNRLRVFPREARRWRAGPALLAAATLAVGGARSLTAQNATVSGSLVNRDSHGPVEGAHVSVIGTALGASSDAEGRFSLSGVPAGVHVMQVHAIGFVVGSWVVQLTDGQVMRQTFELAPRVVEVEGVTVTGREDTWRSEAAFDIRRQRGQGFFITRDQIQQRNAATITDLLRTVPGVMTACDNRGCVVRMARSTTQCQPEYYLDGYPATISTGPNFPINQIRGVEVYRDRFEAPPEFQRGNYNCGVIAIWSVEPGTPLGRH